MHEGLYTFEPMPEDHSVGSQGAYDEQIRRYRSAAAAGSYDPTGDEAAFAEANPAFAAQERPGTASAEGDDEAPSGGTEAPRDDGLPPGVPTAEQQERLGRKVDNPRNWNGYQTK
jgi:hypothetical protein